MTRWDEEITKFLKNDNVFCAFCPGNIKMVFDEKMGYYKCGSCSQIRAPRLILKYQGEAPLYWSMCHECNMNNITEKDQEPFWIQRDNNGKIIVVENLKQRAIVCSNCGNEFMKEDNRG